MSILTPKQSRRNHPPSHNQCLIITNKARSHLYTNGFLCKNQNDGYLWEIGILEVCTKTQVEK